MADTLPVKVRTLHTPLPPGMDGGPVWPPKCWACGSPWPCHAFRLHLQAQCGSDDDGEDRYSEQAKRMYAHVTIWYLRMMTRPELAFLGREVHEQLFGWIDAALLAQQKLDRAREATRTAARRAVDRIVDYAHWLRMGRAPVRGSARPVMGQPRERVMSR